MTSGPQPDVRVARIIATSLMTGPMLLWGIAWVLTDGGARPMTDGPPSIDPVVAFGIWMAVALPAFVSSLWARRRATERAAAGDQRAVLPLLIVSWALLEGAALLAGVFFILLGDPRTMFLAAFVLVLGIVLTFPRAEWFPAP